MADQDLSITTPSIAKSASITTIGKSWGAVGATGAASFELPIPSSTGRGWDPKLSLTYSSQAGNGPCGIGWHLNLDAISRRTSSGVPRYLADDVMIGTGGRELRPELNSEGKIQSRIETHYRGLSIDEHTVVRYWPRVEGTFELIEFWRSDDTPEGFWLVHGADGSLHLFGKSGTARRADPNDPQRVAAWLLQESMNAHGEHICYEYKIEDPTEAADQPHDYRAQRYLQRVLYGNFEASADLYGWDLTQLPLLSWHFHLVFDYGERSQSLTEKPVYDGDTLSPWPTRPDPFSSYGQGFEVGTRRRCQQVLMFHCFADLGSDPVLVRRLLLKYAPTAESWSYSQIMAAHYQAYDAHGAVENKPPVEFEYSGFELNTQPTEFFPFEHMPGIEDGQHYQCVDLFGEGVPGFLCRYDQCWYYREPLRATIGTDAIKYRPWTALETIPIADRNKSTYQALMDLTGNGRLDWIVAQSGLSGFHTLNPDRSWSGFIPFTAFPVEFFNLFSQLGDLTGDGLTSLALIGPNAVRLYANRREDGFAKAENVEHIPSDDHLPLFSNSRSELVMLSNLLGSDMSELYRIRHNEIKCWPNLGNGTFGTGFVMSDLPFEYATFDAARVRIADLDGSGVPALIYLNSDGFEIYLNCGGNGLAQIPIQVPWPEGIRYDTLCQVTLADLQGLGCASLILSVPHMAPKHWRYDFVSAKPYLLTASNNNMGCSTQVVYRSSAQEWLDEKPANHPVCYLPFPVQVVSRQSQLDEITGNRLNQFFHYFQAFYDGQDRQFRGFGRLHQTDSETGQEEDDEGFSAPVLLCSWFHNGRLVDLPRDGYFDGDTKAYPLDATLFEAFDADSPTVGLQEIARALTGSLLRQEIYPVEKNRARPLPYSVTEYRYKVREVRSAGDHYRHPVLLPSLLEKIDYQYERFIDDPLCRHEITLTQDDFGQSTHTVVINYARRENVPPPFTDEDEIKYWEDAHDQAQRAYYLSETRARYIHLQDFQGWRLGLPWHQRGDALVWERDKLPAWFDPKAISHKLLIDNLQAPEWTDKRELTQQSIQHYLKADGSELPDADYAEFEALKGSLEIAQLDEAALAVYSNVSPPIDIKQELVNIGYLDMKWLFDEKPADGKLWSAPYGFARYAGPKHFYRVLEYRETLSHGWTKANYDAYGLAVIRVEMPDGCTTHVKYNYDMLLPCQIDDANQNIEEVLYEPSGQPFAISFHGTEDGKLAGFRPITEYVRPEDDRPETAIEDPPAALQKAASIWRKDLFSWMGRLPDSVRQTPDLLTNWIAAGYVLPSLHICANARTRLARLTSLTMAQHVLLELIALAPRIPVHSVGLTADRYPDDPLQQIQIVMTFVDGFGRSLQTQQRVEPGVAYVVEDGELVIENGQPKTAQADPRWRISERLEYNNKGLAIRVFRPYFASWHGYIKDPSFRLFGHHDRHFYDPLGRSVKVINAKGDWSFNSLHPWYTASHDFNDTYVPPTP